MSQIGLKELNYLLEVWSETQEGTTQHKFAQLGSDRVEDLLGLWSEAQKGITEGPKDTSLYQPNRRGAISTSACSQIPSREALCS